MNKRVITLATDFGQRDPFVGIMKGVILRINPQALIVDLCHEIEPGNIVRACYCLDSAIPFFPKDTIHVVVVDPGVGSDRKKIIVKTGEAYLVAPDNGVLTLAMKNMGFDIAVEAMNADYFIHPVSSTFHGRDVFAPVAAHLSLGKDLASFGKKIDRPVLLDLPEPELLKNGETQGTMVYRDRFGNMATNLRPAPGENAFDCLLKTVSKKHVPLVTHYAAAREGELSGLVNSSGYIELFVKNGNGADAFNLNEGDLVFLKKKTGAAGKRP